MPPEGIPSRTHNEILTYEELTLIGRVAVKCGLRKVRLTGGEPLVRKDITKLASSLISIPGLKGISITTNGYLLKEMAGDLKKAGAGRVNISIDTLNAEKFKWLTRGGDINVVLEGLDAALEAGLTPVKINVVALREMKDTFKDFVDLIYEKPVHVRFIEYMPIGRSGTLGRQSYIPSDEIRAEIEKLGSLTEVESPGGWGPAKYFSMKGAIGTIGFIGAQSTHFCAACNRLRITSTGKLKACLFSASDIDILPVIRSDNAEKHLEELFLTAMKNKPEFRPGEKSEESMSKIGG
jgi:cyclic pyranopterin phosphate synthase